MKFLKYLFLICIYLLSINTKADDISVSRLTTENGLSNYNVISMYQDERGYIWLGTRNGVNLYNGSSIKIFKNEKNEENSLIYNYVTGITGNKNGEVYFLTPDGISAYDIRKDTFKAVTTEKSSAFFFHKSLYYAIRNNIYEYKDGKSELVYELPNNYSNITSININGDDIYIGTADNGLFYMNHPHTISNIIPEVNISSIMTDSKGTCWIGSVENGLFIIKDNKVRNVNSKDRNNSISSDFVRYCCEDKQGNVWIGTFNGLDVYDYSTDSFFNYVKDKEESNMSIWCLMCDNQGSMWVGTYFKGAYRINTNNNIYNYYSSGILESLRYPVSCILEDDDSNLWIGTSGGGLNKYNIRTKKAEWYYAHSGINSISHNNINSICLDRKRNVLWVGTNTGGLNKLNLADGCIRIYRHSENIENSLLSDIVKDIEIHNGILYIATVNGVCSFNPETERFEKMFQIYPNKISYAEGLFIDIRNTMWIYGNGYGVYSYNLDTHNLKQYRHEDGNGNTICGNTINRIFEDSKGYIWFCSDINGVDKYIPESDQFINYDKKRNELISNSVCNVCELSDNKLLFTTDAGISILDTESNSFTNYDERTGLPEAAFNAFALLKDSDGNIITGSANGMISFKEDNMDKTADGYNISPYRLFINGNEVEPNDKTGILKESLCYTPEITLNSDQSIIGIEYSVTNYIYKKNNLEYFLEGFSKEWTDMRGENVINFTNLNPGEYTLMVRPADRRVRIPVNKLEIRVLPPFYKTIWAYCVYSVTIVLIIFYLIRNYSNRLLLKESLKYERKHSEDIEKLNQNKLHFFTNIAHEFRTPLTLIVGQMEMLLQSENLTPNVYNKIASVYKNSLQLKDLISELLDFRKQEQGYMSLNIRKYNMTDFLYRNYLQFQNYAPQSGITLGFNKDSDDIELWFDLKQMQKVINNLLSNAFNHTPKGGKINISIRERINEVYIEVSDTGTGIAPEDKDKIFDCFYQSDKDSTGLTSTGFGIGLALTKGIIEMHHGKIEVFSELGVGTTFIVRLKTGKEHFSKEELSDDETATENFPIINTQAADVIEEKAMDEIKEEEKEAEENIDKENKPKVLIVEDNEALRDMLSALFSNSYAVTTASNGKEGWDKVREDLPDIVISDVVMPLMSGVELCKLIKGDVSVCHIPVVLLTARTNEEHSVEGLNIGADDYICKPFNTNMLLARCNSLINNRMILQEKFSGKASSSPQILTTTNIDKAFIESVIKIIEENIQKEDFGVDMLASETGIARTKLYQRIKDITGKTPYEFILTIRLKHAAVMLQNNPELNITEISEKLGFSSARQFSKHFKEKYKITPQEFRKR